MEGGALRARGAGRVNATMGRHIVGIDLGTTHTVVASLDPEVTTSPEVFEVPRLSGPGKLGTHPTLGSVLYAPHNGELAESHAWIVGDYALRRSREVPGRAIVSAKSWLCYAAVDRKAAILPWGSEDVSAKLSPVEASATILEHVRTAWDEAHPNEPLNAQTIVLTVPASFDPTARQLTLEAAKRIGLSVRLLEEPQAAFYDYLERIGNAQLLGLQARAKSEGRSQALVLVCDVGGGTTDLTLLSVAETRSGAPTIERVAVGKHLLLGGDNMDLALAHRLEQKFQTGSERLPAQKFAELVQASRVAKEQLLSDEGLKDIPVTLAASGSSLVGGTRTVRLTREEVETLIVQGFFPAAEIAPLKPRQRAGLLGFGLPYEADPAITRQVAAFLYRHLGTDAKLDAVLLNGGVFLSTRLVQALQNALAPLHAPHVVTLHQPHPELAVARGATVYGLSLLGRGLRIGGGSAFGYYVAVTAGTESHPGSRAIQKALCVVPRGSREAEPHRAQAAALALTVGKPVRFELYSSDSGPIHAPGELVTLNDDFELTCPIVSHFENDQPREVPVVLEGELSAIGTLELACVATLGNPPERFALAFELRGQETDFGQQRRLSERPDTLSSVSERPASNKLDEAAQLLNRVYGKGKAEVLPRDVKDLFRSLEKLFGIKQSWDLELCRQLFDFVGSKHQGRKRSIDHERLYFMLTGYLLRPGFGHSLDRTRIRTLAPLFVQGLAFPDEIRSWQQFFIAYRRVTAGLDETEQTELLLTLLPHLSPSQARVKKKGQFRPLAEPEMLECASFLERLSHDKRLALGDAILERTWTKRDPLLWTALGRVGARVPMYASAHHVLPAKAAEGWLDHLLREKWEALPSAVFAAVQMGRLTGDRTRDINDGLRGDLCRRLERLGAPSEQWRPLRELMAVEERERTEQFGEELPVGLRWLPE